MSTTPATPAATQTPTSVDTSFAALLQRAKRSPQPVVFERMLRRLRITRTLTWGPQGGGKTTSVTAMARALGRTVVISVDQDIKPVPDVELWLMTEPALRTEIPLLQRDHAEAVVRLTGEFGKPGEAHVVLLDTVSTLGTWLTTFQVEADPMLGLDMPQMDGMKIAAGSARVCVAWAHSIWRLGAAAMKSNHDGPLVFGVTEHAAAASKGETNPRFDASGKQIVDMTFDKWIPVIGKAAGRKLESECDLQLAYSVDGKPDDARSLLCDTTGGHTKGRFTAPEWDIFRDSMKGKTPHRLADALSRIYARRKQLFIEQLAATHSPGPIGANVVVK